jgi:Protein of unknown function (DUF4241)
MVHSVLTQALISGTSLTTRHGSAVITHYPVGDLFLPSGRVIACDPFCFYEPEPFVPPVEPGRYPVLLGVAQFADHDQRVALAILRCSATLPTTWQMATTRRAGPDRSIYAHDGLYSYSVDYGCGSFMDFDAATLLQRQMDADPNYVQRVSEQMQQRYIPTWFWANLALDPPTGLNCVVFSSGNGDGDYVSYWGYDQHSTLACLVTDFALLRDTEAR